MVYVEDCSVGFGCSWLNGPSDGDTTVIYGLRNVVSGIRSTSIVRYTLSFVELTTIFQLLPEILSVPLSTGDWSPTSQ